MFLTRVVDFVSPYSVRAKLRLWYRHFHGQTEKRNDKKRLVTLVRIRVNIQSGYLLKTSHKILCLCFRASLIYINNCPTRCNTKLSIYYSASSLYMFRVSTTPIIRSTQNCNCSLRYCAATHLKRGQGWPRWREVAAQKIWPVPEAVVTVLYTPDDGCGWHPKHVLWACRIINRLLCVASRWKLLI